jgi:hypothetical protein
MRSNFLRTSAWYRPGMWASKKGFQMADTSFFKMSWWARDKMEEEEQEGQEIKYHDSKEPQFSFELMSVVPEATNEVRRLNQGESKKDYEAGRRYNEVVNRRKEQAVLRSTSRDETIEKPTHESDQSHTQIDIAAARGLISRPFARNDDVAKPSYTEADYNKQAMTYPTASNDFITKSSQSQLTKNAANQDKEVILHPRPINGANKIEFPSVTEDRAKQLKGQPQGKKVFEGFTVGVGEVESEC